MVNGSALSRFRRNLRTWFAQAQRDLPWRRSKNPYRIWLSEIMLQQTRVAAALPYYERFVEHLPNVHALAEAPGQEVLRLWAGLGYYSRARNLQKAAQQIVAKHHSRFPDNLQQALELPGIGQYTAAAILSIAYGQKMAVLDGNVARVLARLGAIRSDLRNAGCWRNLQQIADSLLAPSAPGDWNQAMMELGATICTPRAPQCLLCPVAEFCQARKHGLVEVIPAKRLKRANEEITLATMVLLDPQGRTILLPPPKTKTVDNHPLQALDLLSHLWHFPTIRVQADPESELRSYAVKHIFDSRALRCELHPLTKVRHTVTYRRITLHPFRVEVAHLPRVAHAKALPLAQLSSVPISNLTRKVARSAAVAAHSGDAAQSHPTGTLGF